jgi:hypothetical protein
MMSIEDTGNPSASEALAAAMVRVGNLPAGVRYDTSPDYAAPGLASDKPGIPGLAEAARQFLADNPTPFLSGDFDNLDNDPSAAVSFTPILVSDRDQGEREALETLRLEKITDLEAALNQADEDSRPKLEALLKKLEAAKGKDANSIRSAITSASLALSTEAAGGNKAAGGGMEEEKTRLWGEIGKLNEEIGKDIDTLYKNGKITKAEYENYKKNQARIDAMPEGEEKARAQQILAQQMENWAKGKRDEYIQQGDQQSADLAGKVEDRSARVAREAQALIEAYIKENSKKAQEVVKSRPEVDKNFSEFLSAASDAPRNAVAESKPMEASPTALGGMDAPGRLGAKPKSPTIERS